MNSFSPIPNFFSSLQIQLNTEMGVVNIKKGIILLLVTVLSLRFTDCDNIRLPDQVEQQQQQPLSQQFQGGEERRQGKHLLDFVGLGTGPNTDPYLARTNANCLSGELADCFKSQALGTFNDFFGKEIYK